MRSHTLSKHGIQITRYKEIHGPFEIIEKVFHKCYLCGKLVLLDSDSLGGHIKGTHKLKEKDYKEKYCNYATSKHKPTMEDAAVEENVSKHLSSVLYCAVLQWKDQSVDILLPIELLGLKLSFVVFGVT